MPQPREKEKGKLVTVLGPTACGKTRLAVRLARCFNGEIVSADSRQIYKGMDIGTGKDLHEYGQGENKVPYHLIDIVYPKRAFSLAVYQRKAYHAIDNILGKERLPILAGGTGLYIQAVVDGYHLPLAGPNMKMRKKIEQMDERARLSYLKKIAPSKIKKIDIRNSRRVIRAIEIALKERSGDSRVKIFTKRQEPRYSSLLLGVTFPIEEIRERIRKRLDQEFANGLIEEVHRLRENGVSWKKLDDFGLEYRFVSKYLQGELTLEEMKERLAIAVGQFAKRQMTWFKRDKRIHWIKNTEEAERLVKQFIA